MYFVFSLIVITKRTGSGGIWCERCRAKQAFSHSIISGIVGWWGFPFGPIYTSQALYFNAIGGKQDKKQNAALLRLLALQLYEAGRLDQALRALHSSVDLEKDPATIRFADELRTMPGSHATHTRSWFKFLTALPSVAVLSVVSLSIYSCFAGPTVDGSGSQIPTATSSTPDTGNGLERPSTPDQEIVSTTPRHNTGDEVVAVPKMRGLGNLSLINGTGEDAVALLFSKRTGDMARSVYIRAGDTAKLANISPGCYLVRITEGDQWDDTTVSFLRDASYASFPSPFIFTENKEEESDGRPYIQYDDASLTLHAVPDGNIQKQAITKEEFWNKAPTD